MYILTQKFTSNTNMLLVLNLFDINILMATLKIDDSKPICVRSN